MHVVFMVVLFDLVVLLLLLLLACCGGVGVHGVCGDFCEATIGISGI